jgi:hypothetical protein
MIEPPKLSPDLEPVATAHLPGKRLDELSVQPPEGIDVPLDQQAARHRPLWNARLVARCRRAPFTRMEFVVVYRSVPDTEEGSPTWTPNHRLLTFPASASSFAPLTERRGSKGVSLPPDGSRSESVCSSSWSTTVRPTTVPM